VYDFLLVITVT